MEKIENNLQKNEETYGGRHRSPAFPMISFEDALTRLKVIYSKDKRALINVNTMISHLGYKGGRAGIPGRIIAALKQYNLLDEKSGQFRVSETGYQIIVLGESSEQRQNLIRENALAPAIFQRVLAYYDNELPSDENLTEHLLLNEKFNPESISSFIKVFRANIELAEKFQDFYKENDNATTEETTQSIEHSNDTQTNLNLSKINSTSIFQGESLKFRISRESDVIVTFSGKVTQEGIDKLVILLNATKDTYPTNEELANQQSFL